MIAAPEIANQLQHSIRCLERSQRVTREVTISSGWAPLDRLLPGGGLRRGSLVEWLSADMGSDLVTLALGGVRQASGEGGALVVVDRDRQLYPPALAAWGLDLSRLLLVHPASRRDEFWAWDQILRCPGVGVVWGRLEQIDSRGFRRLQLSAESSGCLGILLRPGAARNQPSWADIRLWVQPQPSADNRRLRVELLHSRGAGRRGSVQLSLDSWNGQLRDVGEHHETLSLALAAKLARAKTGSRATGTEVPRRRAL
jgi:hypothetical protein